MNGVTADSAIRVKKRHWIQVDIGFRLITLGAALVVPLIIGAVLVVLLEMSWPTWQKFGLGFLVNESWNPVTENFGAASSIYGTIVSSLLAMVLAVPMSLAIAFFLVELAPPRLSQVIGPLIEMLAAIPSIIYGMWGLYVFAPFMREHIQPLLHDYLGFLPLFQGPPLGIGMLTAGVILAFMILPFITAVCRDVLQLVPPVVKESGFGLGATPLEVLVKITIPYGSAGIIGAILLGLGRALGETMAVTFVIGNAHRISLSLLAPGNSIASTLANEFAEATTAMYISSLIALGLVLFFLSLIVQFLAQVLITRLQLPGTGVR